MADKMNKENQTPEISEEIAKDVPATDTAPAAPVTGSVQDDFVLLPDTNDNGEVEILPSSSDVVQIGIMMQRMARGRAANGTIYYDYVIGIRSKISETESRINKARFKLRKEYAEAYEYLDIAFRKDNMAPVSIRRTETTDRSGHRSVTYSLEVSYKDFDGVECAIPMVPYNDNDRAQFNYLINRLKFRGILR